MAKNKEMKESIKKFREEANKLEQSDALKSARQKFNIVESEAQKGGDVLKEKLGSIKDRVQDVLEEAGKTELAKKASQIGKWFYKFSLSPNVSSVELMIVVLLDPPVAESILYLFNILTESYISYRLLISSYWRVRRKTLTKETAIPSWISEVPKEWNT